MRFRRVKSQLRVRGCGLRLQLDTISPTIKGVPQVFPKPRTIPAIPHSEALKDAVRKHHAPWPLRLWHLASLDAPTVAVIWTLAFAWAVRVRLPHWVPALLALTAFGVYIADRLLDARTALRTAPQMLRERHFFHWRFRRFLVPLAVAAVCAAAWLVFTRMPAWIRTRDFALGAAAVAYFAGVHCGPIRRRLAPLLSKELMVGVLFTVACALPAWYRSADRALVGPVVLFALLAWLNCHLIETWESEQPPVEMHSGVPLAVALALVGAALAIAAFAARQPTIGALAACGVFSALLLAVLDRLRALLSPVALRASADLVLLTPALMLLAPYVR